MIRCIVCDHDHTQSLIEQGLELWFYEFEKWGFYCQECWQGLPRPAYYEGRVYSHADPLEVLKDRATLPPGPSWNFFSGQTPHNFTWLSTSLDWDKPIWSAVQLAFIGRCEGCLGLLGVWEGGTFLDPQDLLRTGCIPRLLPLPIYSPFGPQCLHLPAS